MRTLRQGGGLSGFTKRAESIYDTFGAAHSSTSISAGLGFAAARDLAGEKRNVVAVIGDGAMSAGMAYEAMNNAGAMGARLIVVLNDNDMSIAPPVGAMSAYLARLVSSRTYRGFRYFLKRMTERLPRLFRVSAKRAEEYARGFWMGGTLFEELGFFYVGPIDGHNLDHLIPVLENVRDTENGPILVHVVTQKGKGYPPAEASSDKYHGVSKFNVLTGEQKKGASGPPSYTKVFAEALIAEAERDEKVVAITAAMPSGTGLDLFAKRFPETLLRCRHRRAARRHVCGRSGGRGLPPVRGDLFDVPAARLRPGGARRRDPVAARALRDRSRRARRRRRTDACRRVRCHVSVDAAGLRRHGRGRRSRNWCTWWRRRAQSTTGRARSAIRAARGPALRCPRAASRSASAKAA